MGGVAAVVTAIASVAGATNAVVQSSKQDKANEEAQAQQQKLMDTQEANAKAATAEANANDASVAAAQQMQLKRAAAAGGMGSTILTGPMGLPNTGTDAGTSRKTLLGM